MQLRRGTHTPIKSSSGTDKYVLGTRIGKGQFGKVYRAKTLIESMEYAIKVIPTLKVKRNPKLKLLLQNEIEILSKLKHPNIIEFHELYCDESNIYMVYELCSQDTLQDRLPLPQQELVHVFRQIIEACAYAEKNRALHRDLKPANILFKSGKVKVADWGFSRELHTNELTQSFLGSPAYMAPEVLNGELYSSQADVWSMGVMLYECLYGRLPWDTSSIQNLQALQKSQPLHIELKTPPVLRAILQRSLTLDERKRASFQQLRALFRPTTIENPETEDSQPDCFNEEDVRKCSFYLELAKYISSADVWSMEANGLTLRIMLSDLKTLRREKLAYRSPAKGGSALELLDREIQIIQKLQHKHRSPDKGMSSAKILKALYQHICRQFRANGGSSSRTDLRIRSPNNTDRARLIWISSVLDMLIFDHLPESAREMKLGEAQKLLESMPLLKLQGRIEKKLVLAEQLIE